MSWPTRQGIVEHHLRDGDDRPLPDQQIPISRARLVKRGYLAEAGSRGQIKKYAVCDILTLGPMRDHVAMTAEHLREIEATGQGEKAGEAVPAKFAGTN